MGKITPYWAHLLKIIYSANEPSIYRFDASNRRQNRYIVQVLLGEANRPYCSFAAKNAEKKKKNPLISHTDGCFGGQSSIMCMVFSANEPSN